MSGHSYEAAERFILSREFFGMKLGLENIRRFLETIGRPQEAYETIHVGGTNGKGSVAAMLATILQEAGYKTGLFTSPHLVDLRERIKVNGRRIPKPSVQAFIGRYRDELRARRLSFFEVVTALAFHHFERAAVDVAVIEVGLGGRLDATNVLRPLLTITTDISRDHVEILGSSLRRIAWEKAGIVKPSVPHLTGFLPSGAEEVIRRQCRRRGAPWHRLSHRECGFDEEGMRFSFRSDGLALAGLSPSLLGPHQLRNAALAVKAVSLVRASRVKVSDRAIRIGLEHTRWPGRFQVNHRSGRPTIVLDVCHNAAGVAAFVETFRACFPGRRPWVITGLVKRKDHQAIFDHLASVARSYSVVPLKTRRSVDLKELFAAINWRDIPARRFGSLGAAYRKVMKDGESDDIVAVIGSHFLVGEFFKSFGPTRLASGNGRPRFAVPKGTTRVNSRRRRPPRHSP